jgi:hypothetical protein
VSELRIEAASTSATLAADPRRHGVVRVLSQAVIKRRQLEMSGGSAAVAPLDVDR